MTVSSFAADIWSPPTYDLLEESRIGPCVFKAPYDYVSYLNMLGRRSNRIYAIDQAIISSTGILFIKTNVSISQLHCQQAMLDLPTRIEPDSGDEMRDIGRKCRLYMSESGPSGLFFMGRSQYQGSIHPSLRVFDHDDCKELSSRGIVRCDYPGSGTSGPGTLLE